jgi:hypothetical protein
MAGGGDAGVGYEQRAADAEAGQLPTGVGGGAGAELDRRGLQREDRFAVARRRHGGRR